jgi:hypothetical protein
MPLWLEMCISGLAPMVGVIVGAIVWSWIQDRKG